MGPTIGNVYLGLLTFGLVAFMALMAGAAAAGDEQVFIAQTAIEGMAEVEMDKLAVEKASSADVKRFAVQIVADHANANHELERLATQKSLKFPKYLDDRNKAKLDALSKTSGAAFDDAYLKAQVAGHDYMQELLEQEVKGGKDNDLKVFAERCLPIVDRHRRLAKTLEKLAT